MNNSENHQAADTDTDGLAPIEGEFGIPSVNQAKKSTTAIKTIVVSIFVVTALALAAYGAIKHKRAKYQAEQPPKIEKNAPPAAATQTVGKTFDPSKPPRIAGSDSVTDNSITVPAIDPSVSSDSDPIGVHSTKGSQQSGNTVNRGTSAVTVQRSPYDSPAMVGFVNAADTRGASSDDISGNESSVGSNSAQFTRTGNQSNGAASEALARTQNNLSTYQDQVKGMLGTLQDQLKKTNSGAASGLSGLLSNQAPAPKPGLASELSTGGTARIRASHMGDQSLVLPRGTAFTCALKTRIISELSGFVSCQTLRNVYGANDKVLLIERGSHLDGEYTAKNKQGQTRIFVIWSRVRTPDGVTVDLDSPATGPLGEAGIDGYVDNHWAQRIGGALLLTMVEDGLKIAAADAASNDSGGSSIILQGQSQTTSKLAEKVLDSTINIPPTIYKNQGETVGIYVAKDVDFSSVYELKVAAQ